MQSRARNRVNAVIYNAVKNRNIEALLTILNLRISEGKGYYLCEKGIFPRLAEENDYDSIEFLFKSNAEEGVYLFRPHSAIGEIIQAGNIQILSKLINNEVINTRCSYFHEVIREHFSLKNDLIYVIANTQNEETMDWLCELVNFYPNVLTKKLGQKTSNITNCATQLNHIMKKYVINYEDACQWFMPDFHLLQFWYLQGRQLIQNGSLNLDVFIKIASYLTTMQPADFHRLYSHIAFSVNRGFVVDALTNYTSYFKNPFAFHRERAVSLENACTDIQSNDKLASLLTYQIALFSGDEKGLENSSLKHEQPLRNVDPDDEYYKLVKNYKNRLI